MPKTDPIMLEHKHKKLLKLYLKAIQRFGPDARFVSKSKLYAEAGEQLYLNQEYAGKVIRKMLKDGGQLLVKLQTELSNEQQEDHQ